MAVLEAVLHRPSAPTFRLGLEHSVTLSQAALAAAASQDSASSPWAAAATMILNNLQVSWVGVQFTVSGLAAGASNGITVCKPVEHTFKLENFLFAMQEVSSASPNQRKVFAAVVSKLLPNLLVAAFSGRHGITDSRAAHEDPELAVAARRVLDNVIFHDANVHGQLLCPQNACL